MDQGYSMRDLLYNPDFSYRVVHSEANFHHPLYAADRFYIEVFLSHIGKSSFHFAYELYKEDETLCVSAKTIQVRIRLSTMKSAPLNAAFKKRLLPYLIEKSS